MAAAVPVMTGGTVVNGIYDCTKFTSYTGVGGSTGPEPDIIRVSIRLKAGGAFDYAGIEKSTSGQPDLEGGHWTSTGATLVLSYTCPGAPQSKTFGFTATANELRVLTKGVELVYSRRAGS